jgi:hypothetical protein
LLLFSPEKAAQGAGVLELVAALNAEVEFVDGSLISFAKSARSRECADRQRPVRVSRTSKVRTRWHPLSRGQT